MCIRDRSQILAIRFFVYHLPHSPCSKLINLLEPCVVIDKIDLTSCNRSLWLWWISFTHCINDAGYPPHQVGYMSIRADGFLKAVSASSSSLPSRIKVGLMPLCWRDTSAVSRIAWLKLFSLGWACRISTSKLYPFPYLKLNSRWYHNWGITSSANRCSCSSTLEYRSPGIAGKRTRFSTPPR